MYRIARTGTFLLMVSAWATAAHAAEIENTNTLFFENSYEVPNHQWQKNKVRAENELSISFSDAWRLESELRFSYDGQRELLVNPKKLNNFSKLSQPLYIGNRTVLDLRELYLIYDESRQHIRIGKQQVAWGETDGLRVLDVINPLDYTEFLLKDMEETRIPIWMLNYAQHFSNFDVQLLFIPDTTVSLIPDGRFQPRGPQRVVNKNGQLIRPSVEDNHVPGTLKNADYAARISKSFDGIDISAMYIHQYGDDPVTRYEYREDGSVVLKPNYARRNIFGFTYTQTLGFGVIRSEIAYSDKEQFTYKDPTIGNGIAESSMLNYVVAFDWPGLENGTLSGQIFQRVMLDDIPDPVTQKEVDTSWSLMLNQTYLNDRYELSLLYLRRINENGAMANAKLTWSYDDNTDISIGYNRFMGDGNGLFGQYKNNSRVNFDIKYSF